MFNSKYYVCESWINNGKRYQFQTNSDDYMIEWCFKQFIGSREFYVKCRNGDTILKSHLQNTDKWKQLANQQYGKGKEMSNMSRDRVKFSISRWHLTDAYKSVIKECFGLRDHEIPARSASYSKQRFEIICRPSQFARFLIRRNEAGIDNLFKELKAELVVIEPAPPIPEPVEVWNRSNTVKVNKVINSG